MDSDGSQYIYYLIPLVVLVIFKCFYAACEYAVIEVNDAKIKSAAEKDKKCPGCQEASGTFFQSKRNAQ